MPRAYNFVSNKQEHFIAFYHAGRSNDVCFVIYNVSE